MQHQFLNSIVMAKESLSNYSVSKETALLLDAIKLLDQAWDLVSDSLSIKHKTDDDEKIHNYMDSFDEGFDKAKEFVITQIEENIRYRITLSNFKEV